jgi:hypothetical protein
MVYIMKDDVIDGRVLALVEPVTVTESGKRVDMIHVGVWGGGGVVMDYDTARSVAHVIIGMTTEKDMKRGKK